MSGATGFRCCICSQPMETGYFCLDRRIETQSTIEHDGKPTTAINISVCQTMFMYCSADCWHLHEPQMAADLQLKSSYPAFGSVTPCSRCGTPVTRTEPYVAYNISELKFTTFEPHMIAQCMGDKDFAILCRDCEEPDLPMAAVESADIETKMEATA